MKPLPVKKHLDRLLPFVFFSLPLVAANTTQTSVTTLPPTTLASTIRPPDNVESVTVLAQTNNTITLQWTKVDDLPSYFLRYVQDGLQVEESISVDEAPVTYVVSLLTAATEYNFTLITSSNGVNSSGYWFIAHTAPLDVSEFVSVGQEESNITLQWRTVAGVSYTLKFEGREVHIPAAEGDTVTHTIHGLTNATMYEFSLYTVYQNITSSGVSLTAATAPVDVEYVTVATPTETSITLTWRKIDSISYILKYANITRPVPTENPTAGEQSFEVTQLSAGTLYEFTLFAVFQNINSTGRDFSASTVPSQPAGVNVTTRSETSLTVAWRIANRDWKYRLQIDGRNIDVEVGNESVVVNGLQSGTLYNFSLFAVFNGLGSSSYRGYSPTTINCTRVEWTVNTSTIQGRVEGLFSKAIVTNGTKPHVADGRPNVEFTGLYPGATYNLSLVYESNSTEFPQCHLSLQTLPPDVKARCEYSGAGYSITVVWDQPVGRWDTVEINVTGKETETVLQVDPPQYTIGGFQPANKYLVSVGTLSGTRRSNNLNAFQCATDPRGVIAGSVVAVVIFAAVVCLIVYMVSRKRTSKSSSKARIKTVRISAANFPDHYNQLSADDNRGFTEQYEDLFGVGAEQPQHVANHPENQDKNRFSNVLPYDGNRVKISGKSDYINASFMPGYLDNQEYIATQGPLPNTVSDFWRMIWEYKVRRVVMVANCVELGRAKCEQYWPPPNKPCIYGELLVSVDSETEETNWTLKDLTIKHRTTSEKRTVKHFHFTAWPDHGVPQTTKVLIQFRRLMRQHIDEEMSKAPTVVHCSAGVGRTGTLIALDVLLQQLGREKAVDIHGFVHKMRLRRQHMVQTEAQYVYLHQCILDTLSHEHPENIYENSDMIYINATALKEFH